MNAFRLGEQGAWGDLLATAERGIELARSTSSINISARFSVHKARILTLRDEREEAKQTMAGVLDGTQGHHGLGSARDGA